MPDSDYRYKIAVSETLWSVYRVLSVFRKVLGYVRSAVVSVSGFGITSITSEKRGEVSLKGKDSNDGLGK